MMNVVPLAKLNKPFEAYRGDAPYVFVSYSHQDKEAVYIELVRLIKLGFNVWYDEGLSPGSRWSDELAERIANCALFVFFVTPRAVASENCQDEASFVLEAGNPFLAVHLEETELPPGLKLRMGPRQAILRYELEGDVYHGKLYESFAAQAPELVQATKDFTQGFRLNGFTVEPLRGDVTGPDGESHHLEPKVMDVFVHLAWHAGELVTREQLLDAVWSGHAASDELLTRAISELRRVLHNRGDAKYIETVPKRGYRLIGDIELPKAARSAHGLTAAATTSTLPTLPDDEEPAETQKAGSKRRKIMLIGMAVLAAIAVGVTIQQVLPVTPPPVVGDYVQLTKSQVILPPTPSPIPLVADASRIYFNSLESGQLGLRQLSQAGGESTPINLPFADEKTVVNPLAITPDGTRLLVSAFLPGSWWDSELWMWPVTGGSVSKFGKGDTVTYSPDGNKILYVLDDKQIYLSNADRTDPQYLVTAPGKVYWPRFSPDGSRIRFMALVGQEALFEIAVDGTGMHRVLPTWDGIDHCCGSWTADGKYFVFHAVHENRAKIWAIRERRGLFGIRKSDPVPITTSALEFRRPTIAIDGESIFAIGWQLRGEVVRYDESTGSFLPITELAALSAEWLSWSRDERWLAYVSHPDAEIWRSRSDGSDRLQITNSPLRAFEPAWSPNGETIAFVGRKPGDEWQVYLVSKDGGTPVAISDAKVHLGTPTWSPDGRFIAFKEIGKDKISIFDLSTKATSELKGSEGLYWPRWSPVGGLIAAYGDEHLQLLRIDEGQTEALTPLADYDGHYWAKDGRHIYHSDPFYDGRDRSIHRIDIGTKTKETIATVGTTRMAWGVYGPWIGIAPDGAPLLLRDVSIHHIYSLDWQPD